ncbi:MAG: hypothetical protein IJA67_10600 [Oscillospiraceae bacterium]|nr:hypothetical protein [Oscillospiraceae bacterium]
MKKDYYIYFKFTCGKGEDEQEAYGEVLVGKSEKDIPYDELVKAFALPIAYLAEVLNIEPDCIKIITPEEYERRFE